VYFAFDDGDYRQVSAAAAILYTAPMISSARTLLVPVLLFSLAGCGLKGPLYLPDERPEQVPAEAPASPPPAPQPGMAEGSKVRTPLPPAPQSQKKDRERSTPAPAESAPTQSAPTQTAPTPVSPPDPDLPATTPPPPGQ
jgi:predicted small lipoprotein YifL